MPAGPLSSGAPGRGKGDRAPQGLTTTHRHASEVEAVIRTHPGVEDVAVVGIPTHDGGEEVVAAVVLREGTAVSSDDLRAHARQGLTPYKVPRRVLFMDELPTNKMGKVVRREVAAHLAASGTGA